MLEEEEDPYESLPGGRTGNTLVYMSAGAAAGVLEHCIMYPIDVVRTRMQSIRPHQTEPKSFVANVTQLISGDRLRTFRGMSAVIAGAGPAHALYFSAYENLKQLMIGQIRYSSSSSSSSPATNQLTLAAESQRALAHAVAGCGATLVHDALMNPVEVVKQRMQMYRSPFKSSLACARHILATEGWHAFYRSYFTQLTMNLPYQTIHFVTYELMQDLTNNSRDYNPRAHMLSGAMAGALASAVTTPLDVCKTLLNTQERLALLATNTDRISGLTNAIRVVHKCCGFRGYFQGIQARVVVAIPSTAISWSVYEFFKYHYKKAS